MVREGQRLRACFVLVQGSDRAPKVKYQLSKVYTIMCDCTQLNLIGISLLPVITFIHRKYVITAMYDNAMRMSSVIVALFPHLLGNGFVTPRAMLDTVANRQFSTISCRFPCKRKIGTDVAIPKNRPQSPRNRIFK